MKALTGICVSPGEVIGTIRYYQPNVTYAKNEIVVLNEWVTSGVARLKKAGGILSQNGGITCHASIIAREYKIPCLVAVKNLDTVVEGMKIKLNAAAETITQL